MRKPDFVIGPPTDPYLERWYIIRLRWLFSVYLHHIRHDDEDRALHDHPWWNISIIIRGGYTEHRPNMPPVRRRPGSITIRRASAAHRLTVENGPAWTLFLMGPVVREWGFHCPKGWVPWKVFTKPGSKGEVGAGCGD
jgi:hypothetical protein